MRLKLGKSIAAMASNACVLESGVALVFASSDEEDSDLMSSEEESDLDRELLREETDNFRSSSSQECAEADQDSGDAVPDDDARTTGAYAGFQKGGLHGEGCVGGGLAQYAMKVSEAGALNFSRNDVSRKPWKWP